MGRNASSAATYGDGSLGYSDDDASTPSLRPLNMYGYSKHMFDLWALEHGLFDRIVGLKYFNVYGPLEDHKGDMRSVVNKAFGQIAESELAEDRGVLSYMTYGSTGVPALSLDAPGNKNGRLDVPLRRRS